MALTWVLEIGDPKRFSNSGQAISFCGLWSAQHESAGKKHRGRISKKRNKYLQSMRKGIDTGQPQPGDSGGSTEISDIHAGG
jgi:transposase